MRKKEQGGRFSAAFKTGAISLAFLVIGYQAALFIHQASVEAIVAQERPAQRGHSRPRPGISDGRSEPAMTDKTGEPGRTGAPDKPSARRSDAVRKEVV